MDDTELDFTRRRLTELRAKLAKATDASVIDYYTRVVALWVLRLATVQAGQR